ncbi:hypothetical protein [Acuticoccus sp. I52.16.1]|uniref:hypothetical protein n=1 Tax=Acuticoccus sp. I52.16.1 TaxID=2928472 RepID=UPI001FD069B3|nr:hypothetical protein [Acuticoccus sp. I52.16.1]UOM33603.1 hypothetical protein MRB58_17380 [Acuticoccus sp. I52.16.1]
MRIIPAATVLSIGTVAFLALAAPRLYTGFEEREIRRELQAATPGDTLDEKVRAALAEDDIAGAVQYAELADELGKPVAPQTAAALVDAQSPVQTVLRNAGDFAGAYITGHADSAAGLAGAVVSDLTVVGDVRDIIREGGKAAVGEDYSQFLLTLAAVGLAAEGVTLATGGGSLVLKAGISVLKVAKRTGNLTTAFAARLVKLARAAGRPADTAVASAGPVVVRTRRAMDDVPRGLARAELKTTLGAVSTMAGNAGPAEAVRLMRYVKTTDDATELATFTSRFGRRSRAVAELTGKFTLRAFRVTMRGLRLLVGFLYSFVAWVVGLVAFRVVKGVLRAVLSLFRGAFVAVALP